MMGRRQDLLFESEWTDQAYSKEQRPSPWLNTETEIPSDNSELGGVQLVNGLDTRDVGPLAHFYRAA